MFYPYTLAQIKEAAETAKHPRDWVVPAFRKEGEHSVSLDMQLERDDEKTDRLRLIIRIGRRNEPLTYKASLLLEDIRIRGIDYHEIARSRFYKEIIPKGWHEDIINPNLPKPDDDYQKRQALHKFDPYDQMDFLTKIAKHWNIQLPPTEDTLL